jgi:Penicillinase repressor
LEWHSKGANVVRVSQLAVVLRSTDSSPGESADAVAGTDAGKRRDTEAAVMQILHDAGRSLSPSEVMDALRMRGILTRGPYAIRAALSTLVKRGVIVRTGTGRRSRYAAK